MLRRVGGDLRPMQTFLKRTIAQTPFAASRAINATMLDFQKYERQDIQGSFILRRQQFIERQVKIPRGGFARKDRLLGVVEIDPQFDLLQKFEPGGTKRPRSAEHLAVPEFGGLLDRRRVIPRRYRPSALELAEGPAQRFSRSRKTGKTKARGRQRHAGQGLFRTYLVEDVGIFQRVGHGKTSKTRPLYLFERTVPLPASLHFQRNAVLIYRTRFRQHFLVEWAHAIRTAR